MPRKTAHAFRYLQRLTDRYVLHQISCRHGRSFPVIDPLFSRNITPRFFKYHLSSRDRDTGIVNDAGNCIERVNATGALCQTLAYHPDRNVMTLTSIRQNHCYSGDGNALRH